jgi:hypothetical protein
MKGECFRRREAIDVGGKSRKRGMTSKRLIQTIKAAMAPIRDREIADRECEESIERIEDEIVERIKRDCEDWNSSLSNIGPDDI